MKDQIIRKGLYCLALLMVVCAAPIAQSADELFPRPKQLEPAVRFWTRVYTEADTRGGFIHDSKNLDIVYEMIRGGDLSNRERRRAIDRATDNYREILTKLGSGARGGLSKEEQRVLALWPEGTSNAEFKRAATRLRFQLGQSDRFRAGLARSGIWKSYIYEVLDAHGVPRELAALPHVESSFDPTAYSKVGAAGMWQFMRSTGVRYMRIDHIIDERRDPFLSTDAAARLLNDNHAVLQSWPLAITAYNHGVGGMRRAVKEQKTTDIGVIAVNYDGRTFGFASRNFYAAFLAAVDIDANPEKYFGPISLSPPSDTAVAAVPDYMSAQTLARSLNMSIGELRELNPALTETVWSGDKFVPKGFGLRLPRSAMNGDVRTLFAAVPATERYAAQQPDVQHRVRNGETLSQIAAQYRVSLASLVQMNGLRSRNFIRAGQVLTLPVPGNQRPVTLAAAATSTGATSVAADGRYVVRRGDSIERIARALAVAPEDLLRENGIGNKNLIYAGQTLRVPTMAVAEASAPRAAAAVESVAVVQAQAVSISVASAQADAVPISVAAVQTEAAPISVAAAVDLPSTTAAALASADVVIPFLPADEVTVSSAAELAELADRVISDEPGADTEETAALAAALDGRTEAEASLESNALASNQAELAADPSDYTVSESGTIQVQALETLGHYADWLEIRTQRLRDLNRMPFSQAVVIGQPLELDFSRVTAAEFEQRRVAYQRNRQESFFSSYQIEDVEDHVIRSGESLWVLTQRRYNVPVWLLRQYNPDLDLDRVAPGTVVKFPRLRPIAESEAQVST